METVVLNNGFELPMIGFGTIVDINKFIKSGTPKEKKECYELLPKAYEVGYRLYDMADNYENEEYYGEVYSQLEKGGRDCISVTKISNPLTDYESAFQQSVSKIYRGQKPRNLVYLMHWAYPYIYIDMWKYMENFYKNGLVNAIGVCNFEIADMENLLLSCSIPPAINQIECHPFFQQKELCDYCLANGIQIMAYAPLGRMDEEMLNNAVLRQIAKKYNKTISQIVLRWHTQEGRIVIPSTKKEKHIQENFHILDFTLEEEELKQIDNLDCGMRMRYEPETRFSEEQKKVFWKQRVLMKSDAEKTEKEEVNDEERKNIIYGTGDYGIKLFSFLKTNNVRVDYFCQTKPTNKTNIENIPLILLDQIKEIKEKKYIFIAVKDSEVSKQIKQSIKSLWLEDVVVWECGCFIEYNNLSLGNKHCIFCDSDVSIFEPTGKCEKVHREINIIGEGYRTNVICPKCGSMDYERWMIYVLKTYTGLFKKENSTLGLSLTNNIRNCLKLSECCELYENTNWSDTGVIPYKNDFFDYVIVNCLENASNEKQVVSEIKRVMKRKGHLIIFFPICMEQRTIEGENFTVEERQQKLGDTKHVRLYGYDYKERMEKLGLEIIEYIPNKICKENEREKYGFTKDLVLMICTKRQEK